MAKKNYLTIILVYYFIAVFFVSSIFPVKAAFSFQIDKISPDSIATKDEEIIVTLSITDLPDESYFRVAFQKSDGTDYFGSMKNDRGDWVESKSGQDCTKYYHVTDKTISSLEIALKLGEDGIEPGPYNIKSHRYTVTCGSSKVAANSVQVQFNLPTSTPSPTVVPSEIPTFSPTDTSVPTEPQTASPTPTPQSYTAVYISEAMVNPDTSDHEWIELYNNNDFIVYLTNWFIDDIPDGGSSPKKFSLVINPKNYGVVETTSSIFNNDEDSIRLLDFDGKEKDSLQYESTEKGKTLGRKSLSAKDICIQEPTKGSVNKECTNSTASETKEPTAKPSLTPAKTTASPSLHLTPTLTPSSFLGLFSQPGNSIPERSPKNKDILGLTTKKLDRHNQLYRVACSSLSLASLSYSLLVIASIILKLRKH